jgi:hypothetical protein
MNACLSMSYVPQTLSQDDITEPAKGTGKKIIGCGCAFADTRQWRCCDAVNEANWLKKEKSDRKLARLHATAMRRKSKRNERIASKIQQNALIGKKTTLKRSKRHKAFKP